MKLTDQEQVILKAIGAGVAEVSRVIRAVGYPKATTKKVLVRLSEKGIVVLHRHDWPQSLTPDQRKMMVRIGRDYFNAVSMRKRNPKKITYARWEVDAIKPLYVYIKVDPDMDMHNARADAYTALESEFNVKFPYSAIRLKGDPVTLSKLPDDIWEVKGAKGWAWIGHRRKQNPKQQSKGKTALKKTGRALKGFARGALQSGAEILGAGAMALNPSRKRKKPNKTVIKAGRIDHLDVAKVHNPKKRKATTKRKRNSDHKDSDHPIEVTKHWRSGPPGYLTPWQRAHHAGQHDLFAHGIKPAKKRNPRKGTRSTGGKSSKLAAGRRLSEREDYSDWSLSLLKGYRKQVAGHLQWLGANEPRASAVVKQRLADVDAELQRRKKGKKHNASRTVSAAKTAKRRSVTSSKTGHKKTARRVRSVAKTRKASTRRTSSNPTRKGMRKGYREAKRISKVTRGRYFSSESGQRKAARHEKQQARKGKRNNPSAESIRKEFAGSVSGSRDLYFPQGTPAGKLAKLGKLVSITTEEGTIKPVSGSAWLCADTKGKLHIGSLSGAPLFDGPARSFGHVTKIEYESSKPHLGYGPTIWFHKAGEENGIRPTLRADGKGGLVFRGGAYRLTERGIEN